MAKETKKTETKKKKVNPINKMTKSLKKAVKHEKKEAKPKLFEEKEDLLKIYLYIIVVDRAVSETVIKLLQNIGSSAQFLHSGRGTAPKEILNVLGAIDNRKSVINAFVSEDKLEQTREELEIFFMANKKNRGIGFAVPLSSLQGIRMYKYLTQTF